jgi:hypothetical protein
MAAIGSSIGISDFRNEFWHYNAVVHRRQVGDVGLHCLEELSLWVILNKQARYINPLKPKLV